MSERDEFLAWVKTVGDGIFAGRYLDLMWKAWQARAARAPQGVPALTDWQPESDFHAMMAVHSLCPDGLSHPAKMRWMAAEFRKRTAAPQPSPEPKEPEHAHDWRFSLQDHMYKCDCGATRGDYPFGAASFKD